MYNGSGHIHAISLTNDSAGRVVGMTKMRLVDAMSESGATKFDGVKIMIIVNAAVNVLSDAFLSRRAVELILIFVAMYNGSGHIHAISLTNDSAGRVVGMTKVRLVDARSESGATKFDGVKIVMVVVIIIVMVGTKDARNRQKYDGKDDKTRHL